MKSLKMSLALLLMGLISGLAPVVLADSDAGDPYSQIEQVTADLLTVINSYSEEYPANEQSYFAALSQLLQEHVDFTYIARQVMGTYKTQATPQQRQLFATKFREGLIETYGRGLIDYGDEEIVLVNRSDLKAGQRKVSVKQEIRSGGGVFPMEYSMALSKRTGKWKAINVVINGINMRNIFRSQFVNAAQKSGGDIDSVIAGWSTES